MRAVRTTESAIIADAGTEAELDALVAAVLGSDKRVLLAVRREWQGAWRWHSRNAGNELLRRQA